MTDLNLLSKEQQLWYAALVGVRDHAIANNKKRSKDLLRKIGLLEELANERRLRLAAEEAINDR